MILASLQRNGVASSQARYTDWVPRRRLGCLVDWLVLQFLSRVVPIQFKSNTIYFEVNANGGSAIAGVSQLLGMAFRRHQSTPHQDAIV